MRKKHNAQYALVPDARDDLHRPVQTALLNRLSLCSRRRRNLHVNAVALSKSAQVGDLRGGGPGGVMRRRRKLQERLPRES